MRNTTQLEQELKTRKEASMKRLNEAVVTIESFQKSLEDKFYPSEKKYEQWKKMMLEKDSNASVYVNDFLKEFYRESFHEMVRFLPVLQAHKAELEQWRKWYDEIDKESLETLDHEIDSAANTVLNLKKEHPHFA